MNKNELQKFKKLPEGWEKRSLGEVLPILYGKGLTKIERNNDGFYWVYGSSGKVGKHSKALTEKPALIIGRKGSVGEVYYSPLPCWPIDTTYYTEEKENVNLRFFEYLLKGLLLSKLDKSTAVPGLSRDDYNNVQVAVAPFNEQHRIVAEIEKQFSRLDEAVANLKRIKANLKRYKASVLKAAVEGKLTEEWRKAHPDVEPASELLGRILAERRKKWEEAELAKMRAKGKGTKDDNWKKKYIESEKPETKGLPDIPETWQWTRLDTVADIKGGITKDSKQLIENAKELPYLRVANVQRGYLDLNEIKQIKVPVERLPELLLEKGDILFNEGGDRDKLGRGWIWEGQIGNCTYQNHVFRARLYLKEIDGKLISWFGNTFGQKYFMAKGKQTTNLASINKTMLSAFPVPLPPLEEQLQLNKEIEKRMTIISAIEQEVTKNLIRADRLRQSILKKAFSGKLVPQEKTKENG